MNLGRPDRSDRLDALAAEYALGTLSARARRRLARVSRTDPVVARAIGAWETRLAALAESIPGVTPPPRVWTAIRTRLGLPGDDLPARADGTDWWKSLGLWRGLTVAASALALVLAVALLAPRPDRGEETIVIVLAGQDAKPALVASADRAGRFLTIKPIAPVSVAADRALELWVLPQGGDPRSLGLIPASGIARVPLAPAGVALQEIPALAVSLEPAGGSPTGKPTGPVLYSGAVQRLY
jgi:anti-sigma-K factor RskA